MNNGAYSTQDAEKLGAKVEEIVRADLELETPVPYEIESAEGAGFTAKGLLSDAVTHLFGGKETLLMTMHYVLQQPRPMEFHVRLVRQGVGCHIGSIFYSTRLSKPVSGEVLLEDPKTFSSSKFKGDAGVADKLNANKDLIKRAGKFSRLEAPNFKMTAPRLFQVKPGDGGGMLLAATLPRSYGMGFKVSLDVKEFADLAALVEGSL